MVQTYRLTLAYHGGSFHGFRRQVGRTTVEAVLWAAIRGLDASATALAFAGATDRGVHARGQVVSFRAVQGLTRQDVEEALRTTTRAAGLAAPGVSPFDELDALLAGHPLAVLRCDAVSRRFHASFAARSRRYRHRVRSDLETARLAPMLAALRGTRDMRAFARRPPPRRSTTKTIVAADVRRDGPWLTFDVEASGFLRRQMRVLVATALRAAEARAPIDELVRIASTRDPRRTSPPLAPEGLCLWSVRYEPDDAPSVTSVPSF